VSRIPPRLPLLLALAVLPAFGQRSAQISPEAPIVNFRLPTYTTPGGYRAWLVRGSEARVLGPNAIDVRELTLTIFTGDARDRIETMILSPAARVAPDDQVATGEESIRVINDDFEATGTGWRYDHKEKKVSITRQVRVVLHGELKGLLK
jgi:lipopolysaccharide export system protein LptC